MVSMRPTDGVKELMRGFVVFIIVIVAIVALFFIARSRAPDMLAENLSRKLGVAVSIDSMDVGPSKLGLEQIEVGNAKGYSLPKAFSAEEIEIHAPLLGYFKDQITIEEVEVEDIYLGIEFDSKSSAQGNWTKIFSSFQREAGLDRKGGKKILIKKLVFKNIQTEVLFHDGEGGVQKLPRIAKIELTNISTEGGVPTDQLTGSVLGQMLKQVFIEQNMDNMLKGLFLDTPGKAVDSLVEPFKGLLNAIPKEDEEIAV